MGAAFSPTTANIIFMSVVLSSFLKSLPSTLQPFHLSRYIDDIFILWPANQDLIGFVTRLNSYHPDLQFTYQHSNTSIDFLDLTIYKDEDFSLSHTLQTKTFQKPQNLYQYVQFYSFHPKSTFKGLIIGECIRYARTNSTRSNFDSQVQLFKQRLQKRKYPPHFIVKHVAKVTFLHRHKYLQAALPTQTRYRPIFKFVLPPQHKQLKDIILRGYNEIQKLVSSPLLIGLNHPNLRQMLVCSKLRPTDDQIIDLHLMLHNSPESLCQTHLTTGKLPKHKQDVSVLKCNHPKCAACRHLNTTTSFQSSITRIRYPIRHSFNCKSSNLIYLITCTKCKKQ